MKFLTDISDFFLPRFCPSCKYKLTSTEVVVCNSCLSKIKHADSERIEIEFTRKFKNEKIIKGFTSLFVFEKDKELQDIIHDLKYNGKFSIGIFLGKLLAAAVNDKIQEWKIDLIVPIPLHHLKRAERGYNQSDFIAKGMKKILLVPVKSRLIKRVRFTETQTTMNLVERKENMKDAFALRRNKLLLNKNVLLIDDVITTGATTSECGRILLECGAANVYAASVAIAD
ncbi:MAG: ComF family protein [Ignavibacteriales bacterium]|nr:MAG: ComF family protein [Ignavibacteriales bacterium]